MAGAARTLKNAYAKKHLYRISINTPIHSARKRVAHDGQHHDSFAKLCETIAPLEVVERALLTPSLEDLFSARIFADLRDFRGGAFLHRRRVGTSDQSLHESGQTARRVDQRG